MNDLFIPSEFSKKREATEYHEVVRTADWLKGEIHHGRNVTHTQRPFPGMEFTHFPGEGAYGKEGFFAKRMGVRPFIHDFLFFWGPPANNAFIEMKADGKSQNSGQRDFDSKLAAMGFKYRAVCYRAEEVRDRLIHWGVYFKSVPIPPRKLTHREQLAMQAELYRND